MKRNPWQIVGYGGRVLLMAYVRNVGFGFYYYYYYYYYYYLPGIKITVVDAPLNPLLLLS
jgi:hypothetical protein